MKAKRFISVFCVSVILVSFSACGNKKEVEHNQADDAISSLQEIPEKNSNSSDLLITNIPIEDSEFDKTSTDKATSSSSSPESSERNENPLNTENVKAPIEYTNAEELIDVAVKDAEDTVAALSAEYEQLKSEVNTYAKYLANINKIEAFYTKVCETNYSLCVRMCEYSLNYAEMIVGSDVSNDDKYDDLNELYDSIYDDIGDEIYDGIYDGILSDMYDDYYDGILDDAYDIAPYKEWSNARSDEYDWWSDTRSDVYGDYSDFRSDVYSFYSDVRSAVWRDDIEKAEKKIEKFRKKVDKLKSDIEQY